MKCALHVVSSVAPSCPTPCDPMDCSTPGFPAHQQLPELTQIMSIESVMPPNHLILCHPLLILPSIFPSIRVFSNESVLHIRWPKYHVFHTILGSKEPAKLLQSCPTLRPYGLQPTRLLCPRISQARILEWIAFSFSIIGA